MSDPWMKFYPRDWRGDQALRAVSLAARGLWIECLCIMHEAKPYGHLVLNGNPVDDDTLARMTGVAVDEVSAFMAELRKAGVLSVTGKGVVFSRRMTKDHARAQKGRKAANKRWLQVSDGEEQSGAPNGLPNGEPTTQKPDTRDHIEDKTLAQQPVAAAPRSKPGELIDQLADAAGIQGNLSTGLAFPGEILGLLDAGYDLERDILPAIRAKPNPRARTWSYFVPQIRDAVDRRRAVAAVPRPSAETADWGKRIAVYRQSGTWAAAWGPKPGEGGCMVPVEYLREVAA